jgi:hypothetical protein
MKPWPLLGLLLLAAIPVAPARADTSANPAALAFRIDEGRNLNSFLRQGPVAAHLLLRSGPDPRLLVAFPAGNSGVGLWFANTTTPVSWKLLTPPRALSVFDARHRPLHGIECDVEVDTSELVVQGAVLSSIRVLRDYELRQPAPAEVLTPPSVKGTRVVWERSRLDGAAGYSLSVEAQPGAQVSVEKLAAPAGQPLRLHLRALTGERPLTPLEPLLTRNAGSDERARQVLAFLSYREKFLAGSWRFDTYFGRDTLMSALLLAPVLDPAALDSAIGSVLDRLAPDGEVAHEEDIGEFAVLRHAKEGGGRAATPVYDYGMVDDDFMLAPLAARWLLTEQRASAWAREFLARKGDNGERRGSALARNLLWVVERTAAFARDPRANNLVSIKPGRMTGDWRDSDLGLGHGRYPYDVNAALVPAALEATARLSDSRLLDDYLDGAQRRALSRAAAQERVWAQRAATLFAVDRPATETRAAINAYAAEIRVDPQPALEALDTAALEFHALSLDEQGRVVPILHSDEGFRLFLTEPEPVDLARCITAIMRPFPAGLITSAGMLVANPMPAGAELRREFSRTAYHGTVVWSWQQALMAAGLDRQLRRSDLPVSLRAQLAQARSRLWAVIQNTQALRTSELWSWSYASGQYRPEPFGRSRADVDESNAAQLWSTVYLGLTPPVPATIDTSPGN